MSREWKMWDNPDDSCPECDSIPEVLTFETEKGMAQDGDSARCPECDNKGVMMVTAGGGIEIMWD